MPQNLSMISYWFLTRSRSVKRLVTVFADFVATVFALWLAFSLRLGEFYLPMQQQLWIFLLAPIFSIPIFVKFGLYRAIVRYLGMQALWTVVKATLLYALFFAVAVLLSGVEGVPRTVYGINALILLIFAGGTRLIARWWFAHLVSNSRVGSGPLSRRYIPPVLIYGAGASGAQLANSLQMGSQLRPVAFIDDEPGLHRQLINGLSVYAQSQLTTLIAKFDVHEVLLALPSITRSRRQEIIRQLEPFPVHVRTLPALADIAEGKVTVSDIQEVEIADLLGRESIAPIQQLLHANITDKVVMVTGAAGSIGSELCRQIVQLQPKLIVLLELNEFGLYSIEQELKQLDDELPIVAVLGSVQNQQRVEAVCRKFEVETVYHAAAYKHVPMVEQNMAEGISNNVFGTLCCAKAAIASKVDTFVLISTDKAVRPTNTMGASKRFAELVLQGLSENKELNPSTRFTMVRFGNVLGSSGSVVPLFRNQIANGGPITVTDARIIRYFMTIPEAAELVIQAGAMGQGGDVFVLDMGAPVKILDLAKRMIQLSGFSLKSDDFPDGDIEIKFTGLRAGEKLYEELLIGDNVTETEHRKILRAQESVIPWEQLNDILQQLEQANNAYDYQKVRDLLLTHVDGFQPQCGIEDLLH
ncbi:polysaccharide biosynthesis protein [Methylophaga sp. 42_25_T18]|nr:polysaccharide biosynthesis protein [Methylophaga sp. 42_25_T18]